LKNQSLRSLDKIQRFCILSMKASLSLEQQPQMPTLGNIILEVFKCPFGFRVRTQKGTWATHITSSKNGSHLKIRASVHWIKSSDSAFWAWKRRCRWSSSLRCWLLET